MLPDHKACALPTALFQLLGCNWHYSPDVPGHSEAHSRIWVLWGYTMPHVASESPEVPRIMLDDSRYLKKYLLNLTCEWKLFVLMLCPLPVLWNWARIHTFFVTRIVLFEQEQDSIMNNRFQSMKHRATAIVQRDKAGIIIKSWEITVRGPWSPSLSINTKQCWEVGFHVYLFLH